jgi:hypothetical protein
VNGGRAGRTGVNVLDAQQLCELRFEFLAEFALRGRQCAGAYGFGNTGDFFFA